MPDKPDWNMKQTVALKIVAQLKPMTEDEKRKFIVKLLDHFDPMFVLALNFSYEMTPGTEPASKTPATFGKVTYQTESGYQERLLADESGVQLFVCLQDGLIKLFRTEWEDKEVKSRLNSPQYSLLDAIIAFQEAVALQTEQG